MNFTGQASQYWTNIENMRAAKLKQPINT